MYVAGCTSYLSGRFSSMLVIPAIVTVIVPTLVGCKDDAEVHLHRSREDTRFGVIRAERTGFDTSKFCAHVLSKLHVKDYALEGRCRRNSRGCSIENYPLARISMLERARMSFYSLLNAYFVETNNTFLPGRDKYLYFRDSSFTFYFKIIPILLLYFLSHIFFNKIYVLQMWHKIVILI